NLFARLAPARRCSRFPYTTLFRSAVAVFPGRAHRLPRGRRRHRGGGADAADRRRARRDDSRGAWLEGTGGSRAGGHGDVARGAGPGRGGRRRGVDRKSTRLNSSHVKTSYAVFCVKKII